MRFLVIASVLFLWSCSPANDNQAEAKADVLVSHIDSSVSPAQDFFMYANGGWIKKNPIPPAYGSWGIGNLVQEETRNRLKAISEAAARNKAAEGTAEQKIGDFWATGMDSLKN